MARTTRRCAKCRLAFSAEREDFVLLAPFIELHEVYCVGLDRGEEGWTPYRALYESRRQRVLLCCPFDDEREALHFLLEQAGHQVGDATDCDAALAAALSQRPSVVLLDLALPGQPLDVARRLFAMSPPRPLLVAVSGYGRPADRERAREAGFDLYLLKPIDPEHLERLIGVPPVAAG